MRRYARPARSARLKCIECNAPVVETVDAGFVCVECGKSPFGADGPVDAGAARENDAEAVSEDDSADGAETEVGTAD